MVERSTPSSRARRRTPGDAYAGASPVPAWGEATAGEAGGPGASSSGGASCSSSWMAASTAVSSCASVLRSTVPGGAVSASGAAPLPPETSSERIAEPSLTLSPTATSIAVILPAVGEGTSIVALSDSSTTSGSSAATVSPTETSTSITGTSSKSPMSGTRTCSVPAPVPSSDPPRRRPLGVDVVGLDCLLRGVGVDLARLGQLGQRGQRDVVPVDLEERAQRLAVVAAAVAVGPEHPVGRVDPGPDLVGERAHVVGGGDHRAVVALQRRLDPRLLRLLTGMQQVPALELHALAAQLGEARHAPDVGADAEVVLEQLRAGEHLA